MADERFSDNAELLTLAQSGDDAALERLVENNSGLVRSIASRFLGRGVELEDLLQIGSLGMLKAVRSYDSSYNTAFSTYAVPLIIGEIRRYLRDDGMIRVGRKTRRLGAQILRVREEYVREHGHEPGVDELAHLCEVERDELVFALDSTNPIASLSESVSDTGLTLETLIADSDDAIHSLTEKIALTSALDKLPSDWRKIVYMRYFKNMTQQQCAEKLGITQVKISREEKKILAKLRELLK
ncbi:MAG: sigma-70 family RNA polymerase sigma factor [Ruminococcaceae bacterium]|nr:sigma-70 family RNA polymerase sigma factor [Oscillospiraceae bacterium]